MGQSMVKTLSFGVSGVDGFPVQVEVFSTEGMPVMEIIGLPDTSVRESKNRITAAILSSGVDLPSALRVTFNLAPADIRKEGASFDLPMAVGLMMVSGELRPRDGFDPDNTAFFGELGLDGCIRRVNGVLPMVISAKENGIREVILPAANAHEAASIEGLRIIPVSHLGEVIRYVNGTENITPQEPIPFEQLKREAVCAVDMAQIRGQSAARRALEVTAAGGHNMIMIGVPGSGKTMLARCVPGILPPMSLKETLEVSRVYSVAGKGIGKDGLVRNRPFRAPHFSASLGTMFGGGAGENIQPGEVSLADMGVLYLDEMPQWPKAVLEALRGPLEDGKITLSRLRSKVEYPARFQLVASSNPCPCGYYGYGDKCTCTPAQRAAYLARLDGPVMDRIDMQVWAQMPKPLPGVSTGTVKGESSAEIATRVAKAREIQAKRYMTLGIETNAQLTYPYLETYCPLSDECKELLERLVVQLGLSARAFTRILRIARTIADLAGEKDIKAEHLCEAASFRFLDRNIDYAKESERTNA